MILKMVVNHAIVNSNVIIFADTYPSTFDLGLWPCQMGNADNDCWSCTSSVLTLTIFHRWCWWCFPTLILTLILIPNIWVSYMLWPWKLTLPNGCWCLLIDAHTHPPPFDLDRRPGAKWREKLSLATRLVPAMPNPFFGAREIWCYVSNPLDVGC